MIFGFEASATMTSYESKVRVFFRLRNINIVGFYYLFNCYMFRSYDQLQAEIYLLELTLLTTDNLKIRSQ
jgi:hypothetical protein